MITSPKLIATPTWPSWCVFAFTIIAPQPAKTRANVPIASAVIARSNSRLMLPYDPVDVPAACKGRAAWVEQGWFSCWLPSMAQWLIPLLGGFSNTADQAPRWIALLGDDGKERMRTIANGERSAMGGAGGIAIAKEFHWATATNRVSGDQLFRRRVENEPV